MPSRHGSVHSLNSPPSLLYTMSDLDMPSAQHPSLTNLHNPNNLNIERNNMYDMYDAPPTTGEGSGGMAVRPKRKQVKNACSACQRACKRCDVGRPCERCIKYGMADTCRDSQRKERKKGIKRGPYKKRDGESAVPHGPDTSAHAPPGMINDLQRMSPKRIARVPSAQVDLSAANLIPIDVDPPVREYSYQTPMITHTPPLSLAAMQPQYQHPNSNPHQASSSYSEDQYYTRYDHLPAPARSHYRTDEDYSRHVQPQPQPVQPVQDYTRSPMNLQYPSPEHSPPRERQYPVYDNSSRQMVQPVHHDPSYQAQSDSMAHDESHDTRVMDPYYATHHQQQPQRQYSSESHMSDVHQQQDQQYYNYNAYQQPSTSYSHSHSHPQQQQHQQPQQYGYPQNHVPQQQAMAQTQNDAGYSQHLNYSTGASMNTYPTQPHHQMDTGVQLQYTARSPMKMVHRGSFDATAGMVAHPHHSHHPQHHHQHHPQHVGNVQIQSN